MTNRLLSILILIWIFSFSYLYYIFEYKPKSIQKQQELQKQIEQKNVEKKQASLKQIIKDDILLANKENISEKIEQLKKKNNSYTTFVLNENKDAYFIETQNDKLELFISWKKIWDFNKTSKKELDVKWIIWNNNYIFIKIWENKYLYDLFLNNLIKIDLKIDVEYIKSGLNNLDLLFKTKVWIFKYSIINNKFEYFNFFDDFVYYKEWYLWIIKKDDKTRFNNLSLNNDGNNLIIYYNPNTKEKNIIYKTKLDLLKIYKNNEKIYFLDSQNKEYELENLE